MRRSGTARDNRSRFHIAITTAGSRRRSGRYRLPGMMMKEEYSEGRVAADRSALVLPTAGPEEGDLESGLPKGLSLALNGV